jgi:osmoprotectant transport system substrate-binding protein
MPTGRSLAILLVASLATALAACDSSPQERSTQPAVTTDDRITVASFDFPESNLIAELYSQALEGGGFTVERTYGVGPRELVGPALLRGLVEVVPEYAGTALQFVTLGTSTPSQDVTGTHDELVAALAERPVTALEAAPAQNANTFVVTLETAAQYELRTLSDLAPVAGQLVFGGPPECAARPLCLLGLQETYGITFGEVVRLDVGGEATRHALATGAIDVGLLFTTDPALLRGSFLELDDDRGLQPAENVTPLVRTEVIDRFGPSVASILDSVSERLTTEELRRLNANLAIEGADLASVARRWLEENVP